jgi:hypothetical protein
MDIKRVGTEASAMGPASWRLDGKKSPTSKTGGIRRNISSQFALSRGFDMPLAIHLCHGGLGKRADMTFLVFGKDQTNG